MLNIKRLGKASRYFFENKHINDCIRESIKEPKINKKNRGLPIDRLFRKYPKKLDFCKLTSREMIKMVEGTVNQFSNESPKFSVPIVMIGHSKEIDGYKSLSKFLKKCRQRFGSFIEFSNFRNVVAEYFKDAEEINNYIKRNGNP